MRYDRAYEVVDFRKVDGSQRLGVVAVIRPVPNALYIRTINGLGMLVDDSFGFDDDHGRGIVALSTSDGRVTLTELDLKRYRETVEPFVREFVPEFSSESEMHEGLIATILED